MIFGLNSHDCMPSHTSGTGNIIDNATEPTCMSFMTYICSTLSLKCQQVFYFMNFEIDEMLNRQVVLGDLSIDLKISSQSRRKTISLFMWQLLTYKLFFSLLLNLVILT